MVASLSVIGYFMPVISFLFVFVLIYAVLAKTKILDNTAVSLMISLMLSAFFIYNASLVEFVKTSSSWFVVFFVCVFLIVVLLSFTHGKAIDKVMNKQMAWVLLAVVILIFVVSSSYVFNWAVNWTTFSNWAQTDWFGFVLLLVMAGIVSAVLTKK